MTFFTERTFSGEPILVRLGWARWGIKRILRLKRLSCFSIRCPHPRCLLGSFLYFKYFPDINYKSWYDGSECSKKRRQFFFLPTGLSEKLGRGSLQLFFDVKTGQSRFFFFSFQTKDALSKKSKRGSFLSVLDLSSMTSGQSKKQLAQQRTAFA